MLSCYKTAGLPAMTDGLFTQFVEVSPRHHDMYVAVFCKQQCIFEGTYARGAYKQLKKLAKLFKYEVLPKPQLKHVRYTTLRSEIANLFN